MLGGSHHTGSRRLPSCTCTMSLVGCMPLFLSLPCSPAQHQPGNFSSLTPGYCPLCALDWLAKAMRCSSSARRSPRRTRGGVGTVLRCPSPAPSIRVVVTTWCALFCTLIRAMVLISTLQNHGFPLQESSGHRPSKRSRSWGKGKANLDSLCVTLMRLSQVEASRAPLCVTLATDR
jgi:hypothetical protein